MNISVVGSGKLASEILANLNGEHIEKVYRWQGTASIRPDDTFVVHAGSGRELEAVFDYCAKNKTPLVELATGTNPAPSGPAFPVVVCPNANMLMLRFMAMVRHAGEGFKMYEREILESHQAVKKTEAGTARVLAKSLGIDVAAIDSIRDPEIQERSLGIPPDQLQRHALHRIQIWDGPVSITLESKVLGRAPYASGLAEILRILGAAKLEPGVYDILDFL